MFRSELVLHKAIERFIVQAIQVAHIFMLPFVGILVACIGFCDPDTCWHLALGQWMFIHHELPHVDPFSSNVAHFVFVAKNLPLMQHEWLTDIILYGFFSVFGLKGLLMLTAALAICSFAIIPSIFMLRSNVPRMIVLAVVTLAICAASFRLWVRPEAFSFLFMSILILLNDLAQTTSWKKTAIFSTLIFAVMALWANCHILFVVGLVYLAGYNLIVILQSFSLKKSALKKPAMQIRTTGIILSAAILGTLCTPWHFQFWIYIFKLISSPVTHGNKENGHMTLSDLSNPTFIPLCLVLILVWGLLIWTIYKKKDLLNKQLLPLVLSLCATVAIIVFRRMTPLALLVIFSAISNIFQAEQSANNAKSYNWTNALINVGTAVFACYITTTYFVAPCLPSPSQLFNPPYKAISYLEQHKPSGRLLNDSKFGSMMEWAMKNSPDIFIDGRFDSFDRQLVYDYNTMRLGKDNWQQLLDEYKICWLFFSPKTPIINQVSKTQQWQTIYSDETATILGRCPHVP